MHSRVSFHPFQFSTMHVTLGLRTCSVSVVTGSLAFPFYRPDHPTFQAKNCGASALDPAQSENIWLSPADSRKRIAEPRLGTRENTCDRPRFGSAICNSAGWHCDALTKNQIPSRSLFRDVPVNAEG